MSLRRLLLLVLVEYVVSYNFTTDNWNSFDAYGLKLVANDVAIVQARNNEAKFLVQFGPFSASNLTSPCYIDYPGNSTGDVNFIYNIVVPHRTYHTYDGNASIIFVGENDGVSTSPYPFVGHLHASPSCVFEYDVHVFRQWTHDEFFVVSVDSTGEVAYGFSSRFAFSYNLQNHSIQYLSGWPLPSFTPHAVDIDANNIAVMSGFLAEPQSIYKPLIYLLQLTGNSSTLIYTWVYTPVNGSWQSTALNRDAANFTSKHMMSVAVHHNTSQVVVGMPSMNIVYWFYVSTTLTLVGKRDNGYQRGYGQTVGWNDESQGPYPVILGNTYSFPHQWTQSIVYWFTEHNFLSSDAVMPLFPTEQSPQWVDLDQKFISIAASTLHVAILDSLGQIYVILSAPVGTHPGTSTALGINPAFSIPVPCQAGMYKDWDGLDICFPCPSGTMSASKGTVDCVIYTCNPANSLCPIGSTTNDTYSDLIAYVSQAQAYPQSPESTIFDDILIQNMFSFGHSAHCLAVSPLFWTIVMTGIAGFILLSMGVLKFFHRWSKIRHALKRVFQQIDLIKEGELWIGGLASFGLIILLAFAFSFSSAYVNQYPAETSGPSTFACDLTLRNAKFTTSVQSLSIPHAEEEQPIFDLLDDQLFTLTVDFINTQFKCVNVQVTQEYHSTLKAVDFNCSHDRSILTTAILLNSHTASLIFNFDDVLSIGGLRVSLYGKENAMNSTALSAQYLIRELNFSELFYVNNQTMAADPNIEISLTRVFNETSPLSTDDSYLYSALWVPTSTTSMSTLFLVLEQFQYYGSLKPTVTISISEMTYFVWNAQEPIAKQDEVIFHNLLFAIVCLELFGLIFLIMKLICLPFFKVVQRFIEKRWNLVHPHHHHPPKTTESAVVDIDEKDPSMFLPAKSAKSTPSSTKKSKTLNANQK